MKTETIRCRDLMVGDWVANQNGSLMQIVAVDEDNAYACKGNEERPYIFGDDEDYKPEPIILTPEILEKNGFVFVKSSDMDTVWNGWWIYENLELGTCCLDREDNWPCYINIVDSNIKCEYVHQLQHALRLIGLNEMANNFEV